MAFKVKWIFKINYKILHYKENTLKQIWKEVLLFSYLPKPEIRDSTLTSAKLKGKYSHLYAGKAVTSYCRRVTRTLTSHLDWQGKEEKDKWIPLKFSGFNCQFKLCHSMVYMSVCVRVCKFLHLKHFISAWNQSTQQSNYYPFYIKTFLKTPRTCKGTSGMFYR